MRYLVCYDIADDRRRQRISDVLLDYGTRVQESVFECMLTASLAEQMRARLENTIDVEVDSVLAFALCDTCATRIVNLGVAPRVEDPEFYIV
jgi:CRISPR-associated protein Cas2